MYNNYNNYSTISGTEINWSPFDEFRACQTLDLANYFNMSDQLFRITFVFSQIENIGVYIFQEEKNKYTRRPLKFNKKIYSGPYLTIYDLSRPMQLRTINKLSQTIDSELDRALNCRNYPYKNYQFYSSCDKEYVYEKFQNIYKIMPFWAVLDNNFSQVTAQRQVIYAVKEVLILQVFIHMLCCLLC